MVCKENSENLKSDPDKPIKRRRKNNNNQKKIEDDNTSETDNLTTPVYEHSPIATQTKKMKKTNGGDDTTNTPSSKILLPQPILTYEHPPIAQTKKRKETKGDDNTFTPFSKILLPQPIPTRRRRRQRTTTQQTNPPPSPTSEEIHKRPQTPFIPISSTTNGLVYPSDRNNAASIDILLISQLKRCLYSHSQDYCKRKNFRQLPDDTPGLTCRHCEGTNAPRRWFSTSGSHLASRLSSIEQHFVSCVLCPIHIRTSIKTAKGQEAEERKMLREEVSRLGGDKKKITRHQFALTVFDRLTENSELELIVDLNVIAPICYSNNYLSNP